ncbi:MAG: VCBS repeat-containing protein [Planctomycetes bacterium]|nr:VCBS repeat-containing protein [Planctomycetota bacterium]
MTVPSGLGRLPGPGLGIIAADLNGDHWPDLFVANDGKSNHLWINQKDGTFKEEAVVRGVAYNAMGQSPANMGIALGDADGNGLFDLYITHLTDELHVLYAQDAPGQFTDRTALAGLAAPRWRSTGFGTLFGDFDQDGDLDLAQVNGRVKFISGPSEPGKPFLEVYMERNQLFANQGGGRFRDLSPDNAPFCGARAVVARAGCRRYRQRRGARPPGDGGRREGQALPQRRPQPRPLAPGARRRSGGRRPRCLRRRGHGARRRPPLDRSRDHEPELPVQLRSAGAFQPGKRQ